MGLKSCGAVLIILAMAGVVTAEIADEAGLRILTYPIGLVTGEQTIEVALGAGDESAELYLDGEQACTVTMSDPRCLIDLGKAPHVHLLELIRLDASGRVAARAVRWVNRPGQEAELAIQLSPRSPQGICGGKALWSHPLKKNPVLIEVRQDGRILRIHDDGRSFRFPCPDPDEPHVLTASAIFSDGRRAEAVAVSGGFGGATETGLTAVALVGEGEEPCAAVAAKLGDQVTQTEDSGFEVVFVLDPTAGYKTLAASGWSKGMMPTTSSTTKTFDTVVQQGSKGSDARAKSSWKKAESTFIDADKLWFVLPDENLQRANGFGQGRMNWLPMLFNFGSVKLPGKPRIADAVAASGLVAAAGPRQRAVVVILGNKADRDSSGFTADEARTYLAEVGVPLYVLRNGKLRDDGWPAGVPIHTMEAMAAALKTVKTDLEAQCITWFPGQMHPSQIASALPAGIDIAGRRGEAPEDVETVWRQAEAAATITTATATEVIAGEKPAGQARVEVTAVTVLFAARDDSGQPITDLTTDEIEVAEDGAPVSVLGLARLRQAGVAQVGEASTAAGTPPTTGEMQVAVYIDRDLASSAELSQALGALAERAGWLASLGPVDVVMADQGVRMVLEGATDAGTVENTLLELAAKPSGQHAIEAIRVRFVRDIRKYPDRLVRDDPNADDPGTGLMARLQAGEEPQELERSKVLTAARGAIFEEDGALRHSMTRVSDWALASSQGGPRLLLVVGAGFDMDPVDFYLPFVERMETQSSGAAREEFNRYRQTERVDQVGRDMAAAGWLVIPVATRTTGTGSGSADTGGGDRFQQFLSAQPDAIRSDRADFLLLDPIGSQRHLAAPSGGEVAMGADGLDRLISSSAGWYRLSYQIDRPPDGADHQLEISTNRPRTNIRSTSVIASETPAGAAAARVRRLLRGSTENSDLVVEIALTEPRPIEGKKMTAEADVTVHLDPISALLVEGGRRNLRVSVGVLADDNEVFILHRTETVDGVVDVWGYEVPLQWPRGPATLAVVVEDLGSGAWGGSVRELR